jgi:hypothetical protein
MSPQRSLDFVRLYKEHLFTALTATACDMLVYSCYTQKPDVYTYCINYIAGKTLISAKQRIDINHHPNTPPE